MTQLQHPGPVQSPSTESRRSRGRLFPTQTCLSEEVRVPIIELLNRTLADTTVLMTHAKYAHWSLKEMEFYGLHQLFDEIAETLEAHLQNQPVSGTSTSGSMGAPQPDNQGPSMQGRSSSQQSAMEGRMGGQHPSTLHPQPH